LVAAMKMVHVDDPAEQIVKKVGDLSKFRLTRNQVLLGVYKRPEAKDLGGGKKLYLADRTRDEDEHQGKVGLILKLGPKAYIDSPDYEFDEVEKARIGEWVAMWVVDGRKIVINDQLCRVVKDDEIRMIIPNPDVVL
jgi:hypothetical protein